MARNSPDYERRGDAEWLHIDRIGAADVGRAGAVAGEASRAALEATIGRAFHIRVLKEIAHLSSTYPALPLILTENKIAIPSAMPDGFDMSIQTVRGRYLVRLGEWRDEFALADEAIELIESALRGEIRLRIDIDASGQHYAAERRLLNGDWIRMPHFEDLIDAASAAGAARTVYLLNGPVLS